MTILPTGLAFGVLEGWLLPVRDDDLAQRVATPDVGECSRYVFEVEGAVDVDRDPLRNGS